MKKHLYFLMLLVLCVSLCFSLIACDKETENTEAQGPNNTDDTENPLPEVKALDFALSEDGSYYIVTGIGTYDDYNLIIPEEYEGKPVKDIEAGAFYGCLDIITATIPDTITVITNNVFTSPSNAKSDLKINADETREVAQGRKIKVLKKPLNLSFLSFKIQAKINAVKSIIGT